METFKNETNNNEALQLAKKISTGEIDIRKELTSDHSKKMWGIFDYITKEVARKHNASYN